MTEEIRGLIAYTDGSSVPLPFQHGAGWGGSGVHGYFYTHLTEKQRPTKYNNWIATDRGYQFQQTIEQLQAKPVLISKFIDAVIPLSGTSTTNNYAELSGLAYILSQAIVSDIHELEVLTDSQLVVNGVSNWMYDWSNNGWSTKDGKPVKNIELWSNILMLVTEAKSKFKFTITWVRGHNDNLGNSFSDYNASIASQTTKAASGGDSAIIFSEETNLKDYMSPEDTLHPFLNLKRLYFNNLPAYQEQGVYYQTGWAGQDYILGRRSGETTYSVVCIPRGEKSVDAVIKRASKSSQYNIVMYAKLEKLRDNIVQRYTKSYGELSFLDDVRNGNINFLDKIPVVHAVRPGELPLRALDTLEYMKQLLGRFTRGEFKNNTQDYASIDITDRLYDKVIKKHGKSEIELLALKKEFGVGFTKFDMDEELFGQMLKFNVNFGDDLPSRNQLKRLEVLNPVVSLIAWRESTSFVRYACVIVTDEAYGIWSNYFANQVVLKSL